MHERSEKIKCYINRLILIFDLMLCSSTGSENQLKNISIYQQFCFDRSERYSN